MFLNKNSVFYLFAFAEFTNETKINAQDAERHKPRPKHSCVYRKY